MNHECYVSLEVAKLLKKAGFDWKLNSRWQDWGGKNPHEFILKTDLLYADGPAEYDGFHALPSPTLDVAQRWLREVKNTHIEVSPDSTMSTYIYNILLSWDKFWLGSPISYSTYEEAQESGIKKVLEIILEKVE